MIITSHIYEKSSSEHFLSALTIVEFNYCGSETNNSDFEKLAPKFSAVNDNYGNQHTSTYTTVCTTDF